MFLDFIHLISFDQNKTDTHKKEAIILIFCFYFKNDLFILP